MLTILLLSYCDQEFWSLKTTCLVQSGRVWTKVGDLPGAPDDQPLYSADGSANWLDPSAVRGTSFACKETHRHSQRKPRIFC